MSLLKPQLKRVCHLLLLSLLLAASLLAMDKASVWRQVQQQQLLQATGGGGNAAPGATAASPACRPTGARWTPTQEQVKILKELYYGCGIRSPNPEQIQRIAARLRQYGRIEGKNVFYWFQNHKARERHKKRLGAGLAAIDVVNTCSSSSLVAGGDVGHLGALSPCSGAAAVASSGGLFGAGYGGCGSAVQMDVSTTTCWGDSAASMGATERSFVQLQDYMGVTRSTGAGNHSRPAAQTHWPACFSFSADQTLPTPPTREPETLPLFPTGSQQEGGGHGSYLQPNSNFQWWGAAATTNNTNSNAMTFQQPHHHQLEEQQQYYSFYSSSNQQLMMPSQQDTGTSLELTLSYPAGSM